MKLKIKYASMDEVPEKYRELYEEQEDGSAVASGFEGYKLTADVERIDGALKKERTEHKATKAKLKGLDGVDADQLQALRDENEDLKARVEAGGVADPAKAEEALEKRAALKARPLERQIATLTQQIAERDGTITRLTTEKHGRTIVDALRGATQGDKGIKIVETAMADIEFLAPSVFAVGDDGAVRVRENAPGGVMSGASPREWLAEIQAAGTRKHWFPGNVGAGAREGGGTGGGTNPFGDKAKGIQPNVSEYMRLYKNEPTRARQLATAAGRLDLLPKE